MIPIRVSVCCACLLLLSFLPGEIRAQQDFASEKIMHLCRVWGLAKYYHPQIADCKLSWDDALLRVYPQIRAAQNEDALRAALLALLDIVGEMPDPKNEPDHFTEQESMLYDLSWVDETFYCGELGRRVRELRDFARLHLHCLVTTNISGSNAVFDADDRYYDALDTYPPEDLRVLALCRFWNAFFYYSPYRDILDSNWHAVLREFGVRWAEASDALSYHLAAYQMALETCDSHAGINSIPLTQYIGSCMAPFTLRRIDDQTVIDRTLVPGIRPGDIVHAVDGIPIERLRDSLAAISEKTNPQAFEYSLGSRICRGPEGPSTIVLEDMQGTRTETFERSNEHFSVWSLRSHPLTFDTLLQNGSRVGYIDLVKLKPEEVGWTMNVHRDDDAIVFDVRGYPQGSIFELSKYLLPSRVPVARFSCPDVYFPGMLEWITAWFGGNGSWTFDRPIFALFDENAISHAEYTCMFLDAAPRCVKVGSPTRGSDGNVTWVYVPGGIRITFTGLGVFYPDGTPTQRIGIQPDIFVRPTIEGLRAGRDEVLEAALNAFQTTVVASAPIPDGQALVLYPSPVADVLTCRFTDSERSAQHVEIHDVLGRTVFHKTVDIPAGGVLRLPVASLQPGSYFLRAIPVSGHAPPPTACFIRR